MLQLNVDEICNGALTDLWRAVANQPKTPCEAFSCRHYQTCVTQHKACSAWVHYVKTGKAIEPTSPPCRRLFIQTQTENAEPA